MIGAINYGAAAMLPEQPIKTGGGGRRAGPGGPGPSRGLVSELIRTSVDTLHTQTNFSGQRRHSQ